MDCARRRTLSFQPGERCRERGWDPGILEGECELDDQLYQLVLDPIVQVMLHPSPCVGRRNRSRRSRRRRLHRAKAADQQHQRSHGAAIVTVACRRSGLTVTRVVHAHTQVT